MWFGLSPQMEINVHVFAGRGTWRAEVLPPSRWDETRAPTWEIGQGVVWSFGPFLRAASLFHGPASA
jgi:hypothetical protein